LEIKHSSQSRKVSGCLKEDAKGNWSETDPRVGGDFGYQAIREEKRSEPELRDKMDWKKKREARLHHDTEAVTYDEVYSEEQGMKYELVLNRTSIN
jgi:hypothetical protein